MLKNKLPIRDLGELEKKLKKAETDLKEAEWEEEFEEILKRYKGEDEVISFKDYLKSQEKRKKVVYSSGYEKLDELIEGFSGGNLITITGPTGEGKTTFAQDLTRRLLRSGLKSLWFSYEVPTEQFIIKFGKDIPEGYVPKTLVSRTTIWIERKIVEAMVKYKVKVVFIDHLHYLFDLKTSRSPSLEIGEIMRDLKLIAKKYNVIIFIIAHTTKIGFEERIGLESIRDSSFVGQESDYVFALWRVRENLTKREYREKGVVYKNEALISVVKNRFTGRLGSFKLFYKDNQFYEKVEEIPTPTI